MPDYFSQIALILVVSAVALGIVIVEPWARETYGANTTSYYCVLTAYISTACCVTGFAIYMIYNIFFATPHEQNMPSDYTPDQVPEAGSD